MVNKLLTVLVFLGIAVFSNNATASESVDQFVAKKRFHAEMAEIEASQKVARLKSQKNGRAQVANITPKPLPSDVVAVKPPSPEDFGATETAAGKALTEN